MKKLLVILLTGMFSLCGGQTITLLSKDEIYKSPDENMVVMDKYSFGKYHYTAEKFDTLKKQVLTLDSLLREKDSTQKVLNESYETALQNKELETSVLKDGYDQVRNQLNSSIEKGNQLLLDYKKLEAKRQKTKRWRNVFLGTTAVTTGILILLIAI